MNWNTPERPKDPNDGYFWKTDGEYNVHVRRFTERRWRAVYEVNPGENFPSPVELVTDWEGFGCMNEAAHEALQKAGLLGITRFYHLAEDWAVYDERVREVERSRHLRSQEIVCSGTFLPAEYKRNCCGDWDLH